jgi:hypothetical protein
MCTASTDPQNEEIKNGSMSFIDCHESEINDLLYSIVKSEGSSVRHYGPVKKSHSLEYRYPHFPTEIKSSGLIFPLENEYSLFLRMRNSHSPEYKVNGTRATTRFT